MRSIEHGITDARPSEPLPTRVGRYWVFDEIARGGTATVHLGRLVAAHGFSRVVAIKRLHPWLASLSDQRRMLLREARLSARIAHPNVVPTLDVVEDGAGVCVVMELVRGVSLARLIAAARERKERLPPPVVAAIALDALRGLHAAHEARDEDGRPLSVVHRDISPQNVLVDREGGARVLDFGIAKALRVEERTRSGELKGKVAYMAPEQLLGESITRQADVYAAGVVLWESLTGERLFDGASLKDGRLEARVLSKPSGSLRALAPDVGAELERVVLRAIAPAPRDRFATAQEMALALDVAIERAPAERVAELVTRIAGDELELQDEMIRRTESFAADAPATRSRSRAWAWAPVAAALTASIATWAWVARRSPASDAARSAASSFQPIAPAPSAPPVATLADTSDAPPLASAAPAPGSAPPRASERRAPVAPTAKASRVPPGCELPYVVDANGDKRYKASCL